MKVVVCLKQITDLTIVQQNSRQETFLRHIPSPLDLIAVEEALRVCAVHGGEVIALTVGPQRADRALRKALMMGVDRAVRVWDEHLEGADSFATALVLARSAQTIGFDLLLCGARSADTGTEVIGALMAEHLSLPLITRAVGLEIEGKCVIAHKRVEKGGRETYTAPWPVVVTVEQGLQEPRYCGPLWLSRGLKKRVEVVGLKDMGIDSLPPERVRTLGIMPPRPRTKIGIRVSGLSMAEKLKIMRGETGQKGGIVSGSPEEAARKIKAHLEKWLS